MTKEKDLTLETLLKEKQLEKGSSPSFAFSRIPFGIAPLDDLLGGGIPKKRITLLTGPTNVGKSYLASVAVAKCQQGGGSAAWVDTELSWDGGWMKKCGVDTENIVVSQPTTGEDALGIVRILLKNKIDIIVLDSIAGLVPTSVVEEDFSYNPMAWQARFINQSLPKLLPDLKYGSALILINQVRSSLGPVSLDAMPGGLGQTFFAHFILQVRRTGWIEDNGVKVGFDMEVRCRKSKVGGKPFQAVTIPFRLDGQIDMVEVYIKEAIAAGLIEQTKAWYKIGEKKVMGINGLRKFFKEQPEILESIKEKLGIQNAS